MDLYNSIGALAAAAHASGDEINENIRPEMEGESAHGLDVSHGGWLVQLRASENEPRFEVYCPYPFSMVIRNQYTPAELETRRGIDLESTSSEEREMHVDALLVEDLAVADEHHDRFQSLVKEQIRPVQSEILTLTYGDKDHWDGFLVKDFLYPTSNSFDVTEYRRILDRVTGTTSQLATLAHEELEFLSTDSAEQDAEIEHSSRYGNDPIAFQ